MSIDSEKSISAFYLKMARIKKDTVSAVAKVDLQIPADRFNKNGIARIEPLILGAAISKDDHLIVECTKGDGSQDTLRGNIEWG